MQEHFNPGEDYIGITVVYFCHDGQGNFVMNKRSQKCRDEHGCRDIGGGKVEFGQTVDSTIEREIAEEYGAKVLDKKFLGYRDMQRLNADKMTHWLALDFKVLIDAVAVKNGEPEKFDEIAWFTLDKLPTPVHSQLGKFLQMYGDKLKDENF